MKQFNIPLIHFHIPRTGGTWLRNCLLNHFYSVCNPDRIFVVEEDSEGNMTSMNYQKLESLNRRQRAFLRYVTGHMPIRILDLFDKAFSFTTLRHPVQRALSDYWYCYHTAENPAHRLARTLSPGDFCRLGYGQASNGIARYLSGAAYSDEPMEQSELRKKAMERLHQYDLVGLQEDLPSVLTALPIPYRQESTQPGRLNAAKRRKRPTVEDIEKITEYTLVDFEIYHCALWLHSARQKRPELVSAHP